MLHFAKGFGVIFYALIFFFVLEGAVAGTLEDVKKRGVLRCGVTTGLAGFAAPDDKGMWRGIDADFCRAISVAVFGQPNKVKYIPLSSQQRFTALQSGEVDLLSRNTTHNLSRDTVVGLNFAPVMYYDGQGFIVRKKSKIKSVRDLGGASVCVQQGTTTEQNVASFFRQHKMKFKVKTFEGVDEVRKTFVQGGCDAYTTDQSALYAFLLIYKKGYKILPTLISKEPLAPAVRHGDDRWFDIVKWSVYALINAEEMGLNSKNIDQFKKSRDIRVRKFLGVSRGNGKALGLDEKWSYNIIKKVGNYGELFDRNVGKRSPLKIKRGLNNLWSKGGLMYSPPMK